MHPAIRLRKLLLMPFDCHWNSWLRGITAEMEYRLRKERIKEETLSWIARHVPARIRYWIIIHEAASVSFVLSKQVVPDITWSQMCQRLEGTLQPPPDPIDLCDTAWGIIANAHGGDWDAADSEWHSAAERWRDEWHRLLDATKHEREMEEVSA